LAAEKAKSTDGLKMAHALSDLVLPPDVSLMSGDIRFRAGDHQLMSNIFVGEVHPPGPAGADDLFKIEATVTGEQAAGTAESTGCKMVYPT
jgi:branched-chain amino acid transport system substrate-binding protein